MTVNSTYSASLTCGTKTSIQSEVPRGKSGSLPKGWAKRFEEIKTLWNGAKGSLRQKSLSGSQNFFLNLQEQATAQAFRASKEFYDSQELFTSPKGKSPLAQTTETPEIDISAASKQTVKKQAPRPLESYPHIKMLLPPNHSFSRHLSDLFVVLTKTDEGMILREGDYVLKEEASGLTWKRKASRAKSLFRKMILKKSDRTASNQATRNIIDLLSEAAKKGVTSFKMDVESNLADIGDELAISQIMDRLMDNRYVQEFLISSPVYRDIVFKFYLNTVQNDVTQNVKSMHRLFESGCIGESCETLIKALSRSQKDKMAEIEETYLSEKTVEELSSEELEGILEKLGIPSLGLPEDQRGYVQNLFDHPGEVYFDTGKCLWELPQYFKSIGDILQRYLYLSEGRNSALFEDLPEEISHSFDASTGVVNQLIQRSTQLLIEQQSRVDSGEEKQNHTKRKVESPELHVDNLRKYYANNEFGEFTRLLFHVANNGVSYTMDSFPGAFKQLVQRTTDLLIENKTQLSDGSTFSTEMQSTYMRKLKRYLATAPMSAEKIENLINELADIVSPPAKGKQKNKQEVLVKTVSEGNAALRSWKLLYDRSHSMRPRSMHYSRL